jgi:hypothetical protein
MTTLDSSTCSPLRQQRIITLFLKGVEEAGRPSTPVCPLAGTRQVSTWSKEGGHSFTSAPALCDVDRLRRLQHLAHPACAEGGNCRVVRPEIDPAS